jgi:threonine 3-dehydrogenase
MAGKMKAVVKTEPKPGLEFMELDVPRPGPRDLLIRVKAAAICGTDHHINEWTPWAQARCPLPMVLGHEYSGEVVEVGSAVANFKPGDRIACETHIPCGHCFQCHTGKQHACENMVIVGVHTDGAFADYHRLPDVCAWKLSSDTSFELGAVMEPMGVGVHGVEAAGELAGSTVAVFGAGPIGIYGIAAAHAGGARQILAVDISPGRLELASQVIPGITCINARETDPVQAIKDATGGRGVDVALEYTGSAVATQQSFKVLRRGGRLVLVGLTSDPVTLDTTADIVYKEATVRGVTGRVMWDTWYKMESLMATGKFDPMKVITHRFPLSGYKAALDTARSGVGGKVLLLAED